MEEGDPGRRLDGTAAFRLWPVAGVPHLEIDSVSPVPRLCLLCFIQMIDAICVCVCVCVCAHVCVNVVSFVSTLCPLRSAGELGRPCPPHPHSSFLPESVAMN